jgi:hypothetical protein
MSTSVSQDIPEIKLVFPEHGGIGGKRYVTFRWEGTLEAGQYYQVTIWWFRHGRYGGTMQPPPVFDTELHYDFHSATGEFHWNVSVIEDGKIITTSDSWNFWVEYLQ